MPFKPATPILKLMRRLAALPAANAHATPRRIGPAGVALVKHFEGCARLRGDGLVEAYPDPGTGGAPWTIGWGATGRDRFTGGRAGRKPSAMRALPRISPPMPPKSPPRLARRPPPRPSSMLSSASTTIPARSPAPP